MDPKMDNYINNFRKKLIKQNSKNSGGRLDLKQWEDLWIIIRETFNFKTSVLFEIISRRPKKRSACMYKEINAK